MDEDEFEHAIISNNYDIIEQIHRYNPDAILFDAHFANYPTADMLSVIKQDPKTTDIPILSLVDFNEPEEIQAVFHTGTDNLIGIPFSPQELIMRTMIIIQNGKTFNRIKQHANQLNDIKSAINLAGNSIIIIDKEGHISWVNEGFKRIYECNLNDVLNIQGDGMFSDNVDSTNRSAMTRCRDTGEFVTYSKTWITPSQQKKHIQTSLTPIFDSYGNFSHIIAIESDITGLKDIEEKLEEKNKHLLFIKDRLERANHELAIQGLEIDKQTKLIEAEKAKSEELLKNVLPWDVARSLQRKGFYKPKQYKEVSVLFTDFAGFSRIITQYNDIEEFLRVLGAYFESFDEIVAQHYIEKIKTVGDSYMCVGGLPLVNRSHAFDIVLAALQFQNIVKTKEREAQKNGTPIWAIRIGIHTGSAIAGVIGKNKFAYDVWGETVNMASRMETSGEAGRINISEATYNYIKDYFSCVVRGKIHAKNFGDVNMYFVDRIKPEYSDDEQGLVPNAPFRKILASL